MVVAAVMASCSGGPGERTSPAAPTTVTTSTSSTPPPSPTTTAAATVPAPSAPSQPTTTSPASSPEGHAKALYAAWTRADRAAAEGVAQAHAVDALFARPWRQGDGWSFVDCSGAAGSVICTWEGGPGRLLLRVQNVTGGVPVAVADVRFQP